MHHDQAQISSTPTYMEPLYPSFTNLHLRLENEGRDYSAVVGRPMHRDVDKTCIKEKWGPMHSAVVGNPMYRDVDKAYIKESGDYMANRVPHMGMWVKLTRKKVEVVWPMEGTHAL